MTPADLKARMHRALVATLALVVARDAAGRPITSAEAYGAVLAREPGLGLSFYVEVEALARRLGWLERSGAMLRSTPEGRRVCETYRALQARQEGSE
jgi:hypothetical protein